LGKNWKVVLWEIEKEPHGAESLLRS